MAKGKSGKSGSGTRDAVASLTTTLRSSPRTKIRLTEISDLRNFDFEPGTRPARLFSGSTASVTAESVTKKTERSRSRVPYQLAFSAPGETLVCVRRSRRREVLFAKKKTGKGGQRRPRRSAWSDYKC